MREKLSVTFFPQKKIIIFGSFFFSSLIMLIRLAQDQFKILYAAVTIIFLFSIFRFFTVLKSLVHTQKARLRIFIALLWLLSFFMAKRVAPQSWLFFSFDNATLLFISYLPLVILFNLNSLFNGLAAILFGAFMAFYSLLKYEDIAEVFAILLFFMFFLIVIQSIIEFRKNYDA